MQFVAGTPKVPSMRMRTGWATSHKQSPISRPLLLPYMPALAGQRNWRPQFRCPVAHFIHLHLRLPPCFPRRPIFGWATPPVMGVLTFLLAGVENIGTQTEEPSR